MERGQKSRINHIKERFLRYKEGLDIETLNEIFGNIVLDSGFNTNMVYFHRDGRISILLVPYEKAQDTSIQEILGDDIRERDLEYTIVLVYDPKCEKYKYFGDYYKNEIHQISIDCKRPSDVQIVQSFISYYENMITEKSVDEWDWNLNNAEINFEFNGVQHPIELNDDYLRNIITVDSWFKNNALNRLFKKMIAPFSKDNGKDEKTIYCHFYIQEDDDNNSVLYAEIANDYSIAIDKALFIDYRNELTGNIEYTPPIFHKNNALDYIYKPYLYHAFFNLNDIPYKIQNEILNNLDKTYVLKVKEVKNQENPVTGYNYLVFSASPSQSKRIEADWENLTVSLDVDIVNSSTSLVSYPYVPLALSNEFDNIFSSGIDLKIYRVGQANFIYGYPKSGGKRFVFDCGFPSQCNKERAEDKNISPNDPFNGDFISHIAPQLIIISHWDYDHYSGLFSFTRNVWDNENLLLVAPYEGIDKFGSWGVAFLRYLESRKALYLIDAPKQTNNPLYANNGRAILFQGKGKDKNSRSLLLKLDKTILPGDCSDSFWPSGFGSVMAIENIVIPHHGAKNVIKKSQIAKSIIIDKKPYNIYVCAGFNNQYDHPVTSGTSDPIYSAMSVCKTECTNIANPGDDVINRIPNPDKDVIEIHDA